MKFQKTFMKISLSLIIILLSYLLLSFSEASAQELSESKYCYTNKQIEIFKNKNSKEIKAVASKNLTLVKTYDDNEWSYVYYNHGEIHGWTHSYDLIDGCGPSNTSPYIKSFKNIGTFKITGYTPSPKENGGYDTTCNGVKLKSVIGKCVAADLKVIPLGTEVYIDGIGYRTVMDTGVKGRVLDVLTSSNKESYAITGRYNVYIVK